MNRRAQRKLECNAHHEAGHAVVGHMQDYHQGVTKVTIIPDGKSLGSCHYEWPPDFDPEAALSPETQVLIEAHIVSYFAGPEAERQYRGRYNHRGAVSDYENTMSLISYLARSESEIQAYINLLRIRAGTLHRC